LFLELTRKIHAALVAQGIDRWPYLRLRTVSEHKTV
jgi:hypothetical protein